MSSKGRFGFSWGSGSGNSNSNAASTTGSYAPSERRGEIADLKAQLREQGLDKDANKKRELLRKVLAFMTLGVDTSAVFTEMILSCVTKDLVQKKMVYLYLCAMSEANHELAILVINTLQKDCKDESPLVRGLALRSLASLRLPQLADYLVPTLKICLTDTAPYVRKTAILATLKLFRVSPETFRSMSLVDKMYGMLRDNDVLVCTNALNVLYEVLAQDGGIQVSKNILFYLLNRIRDMSEWQIPCILDLVLKYTPASEDEMFDIMNLLEERLRGNNSAVILACARVFLYLTESLPAVHTQVLSRLREPLMTLYGTAQSIEVSYTVLCHLKLLVLREPKILQTHYRDFFIRQTDPTYVKSAKIEILTSIACEANAKEITQEFAEYVGESSREISQLSIECIGKVALNVESCAKSTLELFLGLLAMDVEHVRGETLVAMKDFLRKYNDIDTVRPFLDSIVDKYRNLAFGDDESKIALAWVLGEFGEHIADSPYILESMCGSFKDESPGMRLELLTAMMKLFFKRPPEVQPLLGQVFLVAVNDFSHADVHDRALLYYRLLKDSPKVAAQVVCAPKDRVETFVEDKVGELRDKLFGEFNTFSITFFAPASQFVREIQTEDEEEEEEDDDDEEDDAEGNMLGFKLSEDADLEAAAFQTLWGKAKQLALNKIKLKSLPAGEAIDEKLAEKNIFTLATGATPQGGIKMYIFGQEVSSGLYYLGELLIQKNGEAQLTIKSDDPDAQGQSFGEIIAKVLATFQ